MRILLSGDIRTLDEEAGFTLIELLVVSLMLAMLSAILYGTISGILRGRSIILSEESTARTAQYVLERMTRELTARVAVPLEEAEGGNSRVRNQYLLASKSSSGSEGIDRLRFVSSNATSNSFSSLSNSGLLEVEYRLEEPADSQFEEHLSAEEQRYRGEDKVLIREEAPADVERDETVEAREIVFPLAHKVRGLQFRFYKDGKWSEIWQPTRASFPEAIEITLRLRSEGESIDVYRTAVALSRQSRTTSTPVAAASPVASPFSGLTQ